jgi:formylglycine-generating enzyme required for sulfatase activity
MRRKIFWSHSTNKPKKSEWLDLEELVLRMKLTTKHFVVSECFSTIKIPSGSFMMGSQRGILLNETPQHEVYLDSFYLGRYPITQFEYMSVMGGDNPSIFKGDNRPVENVSWHDAQAFCAVLNRMSNSNYRLPTEAEWEYACRANTDTKYFFGDTLEIEHFNYNDDYEYTGTTEVGRFPPNDFGLYDMHGNVLEWCEDTWHEDYEGAPTDGSAWIGNDEKRILRGGSWCHEARYCRSSYRDRHYPYDKNGSFGFRIAHNA